MVIGLAGVCLVPPWQVNVPNPKGYIKKEWKGFRPIWTSRTVQVGEGEDAEQRELSPHVNVMFGEIIGVLAVCLLIGAIFGKSNATAGGDEGPSPG
jgi:hypothetical protein